MDKQEKEVLNKRTTIHDVAHEAGVSMTTVSHALNGYKDVNEQTRQKIVEIARRLDYMPDEAGRSLRGIQKKTIALLIAGELLEERSKRHHVWTYKRNLQGGTKNGV